MASSDIYETKRAPNQNQTRSPAVSQRRDEYLRATGGESVPRPHRRHHGRHHRFFGLKVGFFGFGVLALLIALSITGWVLLSIHAGPMDESPTVKGMSLE